MESFIHAIKIIIVSKISTGLASVQMNFIHVSMSVDLEI